MAKAPTPSSESTVETYERALARLERFAGRRRDTLSLADIEDFIASDASWHVKEQTFIAYRIFHRWGALEGFWPLDPQLVEMRIPKIRPGPQPALSCEQARALLNSVRTPAEVRLVYVGLYAGFRLGSIVDVSRETWEGAIISARVKGGWVHRIPAHEARLEHQQEILSEPVARKHLQWLSKRLRVHCGVPMTPLWLRRTFGERLAALGVPRDVIAALLGQANRSITVAHYAPVTWTEMADAISRLNYDE